MKVKILAIVIALLGISVLTLTRPTEDPQPVLATETVEAPVYEKPTPEKLLELTNAERVKAGVEPLVMDERLNQSAQKKADELQKSGVLSHKNEQGVSGYTYIGDYMPECKVGSENLADNYEANPIGGFTTSKPHWDAVINENYEYVGYGVTDDYLTVHFCDIT